MELLYKFKSFLITLYIIMFISIILIFALLDVYKNTIFNQFEIKYVNSDYLIEPEMANFNNLLFSHYDKNNPIHKKGLNTYCLISIENTNTNEIAIVEKSNCSAINLYKIENNDLVLLKRIQNKQMFDASAFFIVSLENKDSARYILEYQDKSVEYIFPRIVDIGTWEVDYRNQTLILNFLKLLIIISFAYIVINSFFLIFAKKKEISKYLKSKYFKQYLITIAINLLAIALVFFVEYRYNFTNGYFFISVSKYLILFTLLYSLIEYQVIFSLYKKKQQIEKVEVLSTELDQIKSLNFDRILNIDNYSKTIALENIGQLFLFLDGEIAFLNTMDESNYQAIITKIKSNIQSYKKELKGRYEYLVPTNRINQSKFSYDLDPSNRLSSEKPITVALYDNDEKNTYNYLSVLYENNINSLKIYDEKEILELVLNDEIDLLIINPYSTGEKCKMLCSDIRNVKAYYEFPILMMNKFCSFFYINEFKNLDINDFITNPIEIHELIIRIRNLIHQKEMYSKNKELRISEKEKNTFLYFITHNINTPLTMLINQINDLSQCDSLPEGLKDDVVDIQITCEEINQIIQNVLAAFRLNDGNFINVPQLIDLKYIINNLKISSNNKAKNKNQVILWQEMFLPEFIMFDRIAIRGILNNLIDNAIKYSPFDSKIYVKTKKENDQLIIEVINEGPVIKDDELESLFSKNSDISTKPTGGEVSLGLGLNTSFRLAKLNKSGLSYTKTDDSKNLFSLRIPLNQEDIDA